jgi:hypothetical protein
MSRPVLLLFLGLAAALAGLGLLADRALVREAAASAELSSAKSEQEARAAALSVRGALGQIEQDLLAGRSRAGVRQQTLALPPSFSAWSGRPYHGRPREDLVALLLSTEVTAWGLPEAVVPRSRSADPSPGAMWPSGSWPDSSPRVRRTSRTWRVSWASRATRACPISSAGSAALPTRTTFPRRRRSGEA